MCGSVFVKYRGRANLWRPKGDWGFWGEGQQRTGRDCLTGVGVGDGPGSGEAYTTILHGGAFSNGQSRQLHAMCIYHRKKV